MRSLKKGHVTQHLTLILHKMIPMSATCSNFLNDVGESINNIKTIKCSAIVSHRRIT